MNRTVLVSNARQLKNWLLRLPLLTRCLLLSLFLVHIVTVTLSATAAMQERAALVPSKLGLDSMYRTNTYALVHPSIVHVALNIAALASLLERFELENGTLATLSLFAGPFGTVPALLYVLIERFLLKADGTALGASVWVFLLWGIEWIRTQKTNPFFVVGTYRVPTWTLPLVVIVIVAALVPNTSILIHLCGLFVGYGYGLGIIKFLAPPEKMVRLVETKLSFVPRLPHYVSLNHTTAGRFEILPHGDFRDAELGMSTEMSAVEGRLQRRGS